MEHNVDRIKPSDIEDLPMEVLTHYKNGTKQVVDKIEELEAMAEWERSIEFNQEEAFEVMYDNREVFKSNHKVVQSVVLKKEFGEIYYN